jgi:hypothetical protein
MTALTRARLDRDPWAPEVYPGPCDWCGADRRVNHRGECDECADMARAAAKPEPKENR